MDISKKKTTKYKDGKIWVNSVHKYLPIVDAIPENAVYWKESTGHIPDGIIALDERKNRTVYHVHKKVKMADLYGKHIMYVIENGGTEK